MEEDLDLGDVEEIPLEPDLTGNFLNLAMDFKLSPVFIVSQTLCLKA